MKLIKIQNEIKVVSELTPDEIERLAKAKKNVLTDNCGKPIFGVSRGSSSFNEKNATFDETSDSGKAMLTIVCTKEDCENCDILSKFTEDFIAAIENLQNFEGYAKEVLTDLDARIKAITENATEITID